MKKPSTRGISMIETVVAIAIAGSVLTAAIAAAGATANAGHLADDQGFARVIATEILEEMTSKPYSADTQMTVAELNLSQESIEALSESGSLGGLGQLLQGGFTLNEPFSGNDLTFSLQGGTLSVDATVEDTSGAGRSSKTNFLSYDGLVESPPTGPTGDPIPGSTGLTRTVEIVFLDPADPSREIGTDQGLAVAKVRVLRGAELLGESCLIRAKALEEVPVR